MPRYVSLRQVMSAIYKICQIRWSYDSLCMVISGYFRI